MAGELDLVARLLAFANGRAQPIASHHQVAVRPDALVVCPVAMAGEDTSVHAVAYGSVGRPPVVMSVPDPRVRDDQYRLFERLGEEVERHFAARRHDGTYPQLWVSSSAAVAHLDVLADRLRYNRENAAVKRFGELLSCATERHPIAGQQALVAATAALRAHWATGQQPGEDEHLGALLAWLDPPADGDVLSAVAAAELVPMGVKTDPACDRDVLEPLVTAGNEVRRSGAGPTVLAGHAARVEASLAPVVLRIYEATQRAIALLLGAGMPPLPELATLERIEAEAFADFMSSRDEGYPLALNDSPKAAVYKLVAREDALENVEAALRLGDRVARARARLAGNVLTATVTAVRTRPAGPRKQEIELEVESRQRVLRIRRRDELCWASDPRLRFTVLRVRRDGRATRVSVRLTSGYQAVGVPGVGAALELVPGVPDWSKIWRTRSQLKLRITTTPWTHRAEERPVAARARTAPADPLALVEDLR